MWDTVIPEKPVWNWHIPFLCKEIQTLLERVFANKPRLYDWYANVPPSTTKSTLASVLAPAWAWTRMPTFRSICGSFTHPLALDLSRRCRDVIQSDKYRRLFPEIRLRQDQATKSYFGNTKGGTRYSVGIGGSVTGMHGHALIVDDPLDPNKALSELEIQTANNWMTMTLPSRRVDRVVVPILVIMQRLAQDDPTGNRLGNKEAGPVRHVCLPATDEYPIKPRYLKRRYRDGLLDPIRLPRTVLKEAMADGEFAYAGQYGQSPIPLGGLMFKTDRIKLDDPNNIISRVRYWDKAGTLDGGSFTVGVLMGVDKDGSYWVLDVVRGQWDTSQREDVILQTAKLDGVGVRIGLEQEPGSSGKDSAKMTLRNLRGHRVLIERPTGDKVVRADPYSAQVNGGNVYAANGEWTRPYLDELKHFPAGKYKDQVDASSGAFRMLAQPPIVVGAL